MITLVTTYYNEPEYLQKYIEAFNQYNKSLVKRLIVVDDGSQKLPAKDVIINQDNISLFVVDEDLGFNSHGARNLAAKHVETDWIFFADIDIHIPPNTINDLVKNIFNNRFTNTYYSFIGHSYIEGSIENKKQSRNVFCIKQKDFWKSGGYDEEYVGIHHGDVHLFKKIDSYMNLKILDSCVYYRRGGRKFVYKRGGITEYDDEKMIILHPENRPEMKHYTSSVPNVNEINVLVKDRINHPEIWKDMKVCNFKWYQEF
jgi:glycosyltransferase involved in cell wall biosynthesis